MIHRAFGMASLFFTTVAVLTGIQNYLFGPKGTEFNANILGGGGGGGGGGPISGPIYGYPVPAAYPYDDGGAYVDDFFSGSSGYLVFRGSCGYFIKNNEDSNATPEKYFIHLPPACRLGFGVDVLVLLGTIFTALGVYTRALAIAKAEVPAVSAAEGTAPNYEMMEVPK
jgi:hypothetical protein